VLELVGDVGVALAPEAELAAEVEFPIGSPCQMLVNTCIVREDMYETYDTFANSLRVRLSIREV
jgi:hypothetical protein